jgi:hypothetical protein
MINNERIKSGFDAEVMIGRGWFLTAIQTLIENGVLSLPLGITITDVEIIDDPEWDLDLTTSIENFIVKARLSIENKKFLFVADFNDTTFEIDLPSFGKLAATPTLKKVLGDNDHENAMALLINLDIRATPQNEEPLPAGEHLPRGNEDQAVSFLPNGQHIALGIARESFFRFANNIWHTELRDEDGSHPLPKPGEDKKGNWKKVKVSVNKNRIKFTLQGVVPIDLWPDADVKLELELKPKIVDGKLTFSIDTDLDVDTGFWGDVLAFTIGALIGVIVAIFTGGLVLIPSFGLGAVIFLEIGEFVAGEVIERMIVAKDSDGKVISSLFCQNEVVKFASPKASDDSFSVGVFDAIPTSIPIHVDKDDPLYNRMVTVNSVFDEIQLDGNGLTVAGKSAPSEMFEPQEAKLVESSYAQDKLIQLKYQIPSTNNEMVLDLNSVFDRLKENELKPPLKHFPSIGDAIIQMPAGKLCCPCLKPTQIQRKKTIITRIKFSSGLELNTQDAVSLQDKAGIYLKGLQLIHPKDGNPYFRAPANETTEDNFESLPEY